MQSLSQFFLFEIFGVPAACSFIFLVESAYVRKILYHKMFWTRSVSELVTI